MTDDPLHVEDLFLADDIEALGPWSAPMAETLRGCHTHTEFEQAREELADLFDRVLREPWDR